MGAFAREGATVGTLDGASDGATVVGMVGVIDGPSDGAAVVAIVGVFVGPTVVVGATGAMDAGAKDAGAIDIGALVPAKGQNSAVGRPMYVFGDEMKRININFSFYGICGPCAIKCAITYKDSPSNLLSHLQQRKDSAVI